MKKRGRPRKVQSEEHDAALIAIQAIKGESPIEAKSSTGMKIKRGRPKKVHTEGEEEQKKFSQVGTLGVSTRHRYKDGTVCLVTYSGHKGPIREVNYGAPK